MPTLDPNDKFFTIKYTEDHDRVAILSRSNCGPIQITVSASSGNEVEQRFFRPDSPIYNINNSVVAGNVIIKLRDTANTRDVIVVTFYNNTTSNGEVFASVALNDIDATAQHIETFDFTLKTKQSCSVHIVLNRD